MDYTMEQLLPVLSELAQKYTRFESTSVTYEQAQMLMEAVLYCLNEYNHSAENSLLPKNSSVKEQYQLGSKLLREKTEEIRTVFNELSLGFEDFGVRRLRETVQKKIPRFLQQYDILFHPQDTVVTLDYPLLCEQPALTGADAVAAYIRAIRTEQQFLTMFDRQYVLSVLESYDPAYQETTENICGIVLCNTIGHIAIQKPLQDTHFQPEEYVRLSKQFGGKTISDLEDIITGHIQNTIRPFYDSDTALLSYLSREAHPMAVWIDAAVRNGQLNKIFVL